jgi:hypothetical protein
METSYNGYPASKDPAEIKIKSYPVKGTDRKLRCAESVGPLLAAFAAEFHELIEPIDEARLTIGVTPIAWCAATLQNYRATHPAPLSI